ncbi:MULTISPECIES: hypothetical protein [Prochlorococcus]|nr:MULTISPECIES: hypothetical protein [Prochlorococcus]KGG25154.1 hypothetical protein EV09_0048 [Prochlorococcus marinus str. SS35]KGG14079.1 hypothetical protein EV04_0564 [Prochlorococcus marinus str. LG]KGG20753.1 hypothetical protein EV08_0957 [Prochlorococcus marinus str. SS2]KGG33294.1 hypothetical protein EV10_0501 [Prochlorococcus marinus str. SS51]KGG35599.1 hypothetical protein EV11_1163 [Prochlorococcus sp. SS52]
MPTHEEIKAAKAHLKAVDNAQELILQDMFDDLRSNYENNLPDLKDMESD